MTGNFKLAKRVSFMLPHYSAAPLTFFNVYYDRFNSIFKGFYLLVPEENAQAAQAGRSPLIFQKLMSTERFGSQDIVEVEIVNDANLPFEQKALQKYLNYCVNNEQYQMVEAQKR